MSIASTAVVTSASFVVLSGFRKTQFAQLSYTAFVLGLAGSAVTAIVYPKALPIAAGVCLAGLGGYAALGALEVGRSGR